ncbi:hypothetical protein [Cryobacterium serini]|uniref:Uncharacterized protein n=1 Tax=Cryobacterium serini TaxID=1259201 RepID=A0A4V3IX68_9MICO|nr:hypothetical protein [Cryobacterium serini]TFD88994.1 hypothetical protein E3T51_06630 [Cryobacterium serini]
MLFLIYFLLVFLVVGIVRVASRNGLAVLAVTVPEIGTVAARRFSRSIMLRNIGALLAGGMVLWSLDRLNQAQPGWYGLPLLLAPGVAAAIGLLVFALCPTRIVTDRPARRSADLVPRRVWTYGPAWGFLLPLGAAVATVVFAIIAGLASSAQPDGAFRSITIGQSTASPYPGWYYGVPLIGLTVLLAAVTLFALGRIASAARSEQFEALDRAVRILATRVVMQLSSGALFLYSGGVLLVAGWATRNAATTFLPGGTAASAMQPAATIGLTELVAGLIVTLLGGVLVILSILDATRQPLDRVSSAGAPTVDAASTRPS